MQLAATSSLLSSANLQLLSTGFGVVSTFAGMRAQQAALEREKFTPCRSMPKSGDDPALWVALTPHLAKVVRHRLGLSATDRATNLHKDDALPHKAHAARRSQALSTRGPAAQVKS